MKFTPSIALFEQSLLLGRQEKVALSILVRHYSTPATLIDHILMALRPSASN